MSVFAICRSMRVAVLGMLWPILSWAGPQITGLRGSGKEGAALVIKGTGFGTRGSGQVMATPDAYIVDTDTLWVPEPGVLANDRDSSGRQLTAQLSSGPAHGLLRLYPDGSFRYVPDPAFWGTDTFTYRASNPLGDTATATVTLVVHKQLEIVFREAQSGASSASRTVATAGSVNNSPGDLTLVAIATKPFHPALAVTGLGAGWTLVRAQCSGRGQTGVEIWAGRRAARAGTVSAIFPSALVSAAIVACRYSGADLNQPFGAVVSGNTNGSRGTCSGGVDAARYALGLTPQASDALVFGAVSLRNRTTMPGLGYRKRGEVRAGSGGDQASVVVVDRAVQGIVSIDGTLSGATDWAMIGLEIRPAKQLSSGSRPTEPRAPRTAAKPTLLLPVLQVSPNPARDGAEISFELVAYATVRVGIHDAAGRRIRTLVHGGQSAGLRQVTWDGRDQAGKPVASGVYFIRLEVDSRRLTRKLVVQR